MKFKKLIFRFITISVLLYCCYRIPENNEVAAAIPVSPIFTFSENYSFPDTEIKDSQELKILCESLKSYLIKEDMKGALSFASEILKKLEKNNFNDHDLSEAYYMVGIYLLKSGSISESIRYLNLTASIKEKNNEIDERYVKSIYNLSVAFYLSGDLKKNESFAMRSMDLYRKIYGEDAPELLYPYMSSILAFLNIKDYEKAISFSDKALIIALKNPDVTPPSILADLYGNLGSCYNSLNDRTKSKIYNEKSLSIYEEFNLPKNLNYINLVQRIASNYSDLGFTSEAQVYYEKAFNLSTLTNSVHSFIPIYSYCLFLTKVNQARKGEIILNGVLKKAKIIYDSNPRDYFELLNYYANYLRDYTDKLPEAIELYKQCLRFVENNQQDFSLRYLVYIGYATALEKTGETSLSLEFIQKLLFNDIKIARGNYDNPPDSILKPDLYTLRILRLKYKILYDIYKKEADLSYLKAASGTSEIIVATLDKARINISEEESRLILGDKYRDSYLNSIHDFYLLYSKTGEKRFLEKAFEYSEKSKVAGLLTSTRELKATQFQIPANTSDYERNLQRRISLLNVKIAEETSKEPRNGSLIAKLKEGLLETTRSRDSLILIFEKEYPEYYAIKYNTRMTGLKDIPKLVGHEGNYINYVLSDSILYTFVANSKNQQIIAVRIDSSFFNDIKKFKGLLSLPSPNDNTSLKFEQFQEVGHRLYLKLIDPIRSFLVSDKICISPDNILSYIPFETIPSASSSGKSKNYRDLRYLMNEYDISYTYSATLMAENMKKDRKINNTLIAFAPSYPEPINIQSVTMSRQETQGMLNDLPYARREAEFVAKLTNGKLYENGDASESVYKKESGKYDIIHLAMHTLLNDKDPMRSTLIFSHPMDTIDDGYLKTYEVYGVPLKARMVVLSSCNTGAGLLLSGEGILSLARGFIYCGSQSVVMSMWEIEDKSGTEIVEKFYRNLKDGYSKSEALKKARISFLNKSDLLRSHPYFWSSLVIYGNDTPLYYSKKMIITIITVVAVLLLIPGYYFWKRRYS